MPSLPPALKHWRAGHWLAVFIVPASALFFVGGPEGTALPSLRHIWNLGHTVFFFAATLAWLHFRPIHRAIESWQHLAVILALSLCIETVQHAIGRNFSTLDILRNLTGTALALAWLHRRSVHPAVISFFLLCLVIDLTGAGLSVRTDIRIQTQAPIIEDFEHLSSLRYWDRLTELSDTHRQQGRYSGAFELQPGRYAGAMLAPVLRDWRDYQAIELSVHSPRALTESFVVRIHDRAHEASEQRFDDRFNRSFRLQAGWNRIEIPLTDIANAPRKRTMELASMYQVGFFISQLQQPVTLHIDQIQLIP